MCSHVHEIVWLFCGLCFVSMLASSVASLKLLPMRAALPTYETSPPMSVRLPQKCISLDDYCVLCNSCFCLTCSRNLFAGMCLHACSVHPAPSIAFGMHAPSFLPKNHCFLDLLPMDAAPPMNGTAPPPANVTSPRECSVFAI